MSHISVVLKAAQAQNLELLNNELHGVEPAFVDVDIKHGILPDSVRVAGIHPSGVTPYWGQTLALQVEPGKIHVAPGFQCLLKSIDPDDGRSILFGFIHGEEHFMMGGYKEPFDFHIPWRADLPILPNRQVIPFEIIERQLAYHLARSKAIFTAIRVFQPNLRIINVICPPPPLKETLTDDFFPTAAFWDSSKSDTVRLKDYLVYEKSLRDIASILNIESLMPPSETVDQNGMLKPEYTGGASHGNHLYGEKVLAQMKELIQAGAS